MLLLSYLLILLFITFWNKSVATFLFAIQTISICGTFLIGKYYFADSLFESFNILITIVILHLFISPWRSINKIKEITVSNEQKINRLTKVLILLSILPFIVHSATAIIIHTFVDNINEFKYTEDLSTLVYYNLPINIKLIILSNYLYYLSYFFIPLHFYHIYKGNYRFALLCFLFSLNLIIYGLTFFSRWVIIHYAFLYISFLIIVYNALDKKIKKIIKRGILISSTLIIFLFVNISINRFSDNKIYIRDIPSNSLIQSPVIYSYFDYSSQWYKNSNEVLKEYDFEIFKGKISAQPILRLLGQYNVIKYSPEISKKLRKKIWPDHYSTFNGLVAYIIYDFGYIIAFFISLIYYLIVKLLKPKNEEIKLINLLLMALLIQLPLMAIFYSTLGEIVIPLLFFLPIYIYLKISFKSIYLVSK